MSEEKMRAEFEAWQVSGGFKRPNDPGEWEAWQAAWQAALQESEAGAVAEVRYSSHPFKDQIITWTNSTVPPVLGDKLYLAPPSAQAIETAAIMKCVEVCQKHLDHVAGNGPLSSGMKTIFSELRDEFIALIPQDGRTALEDFGMRVADKAFSAGYANDGSNIRAIVTNLIGEKK